jgi:hypothetical protein
MAAAAAKAASRPSLRGQGGIWRVGAGMDEAMSRRRL